MERVRRWDTGQIGKVERTDQGYLRCPATITKTGVFSYVQPGGNVRRELRLPSEVFDEEAMRSFGLAPLTNGHPRQPNGKPIMLDATNTARHQIGSIVEPKADGDGIAAVVQITDAAAIAEAERGKRQLSCGYNCGLEFTPGVTSGIVGVADGQHYDAIQRGIRGNHVALVDKGRAGSNVQLRLDGADAFQIEAGDEPQNQKPEDTQGPSKAKPGAKSMEPKITIDGVTYEVSEQVAQAVAKEQARTDGIAAELVDVKAKLETERARADAAEEGLTAEKQAHADAADPKKLREAVNARLTLERSASPILGDEVKFDDMTDRDIMAAVVEAAAADKEKAKERLDGCTDEYLVARFDAAVESWDPDSQRNDGLAAARAAGKAAARTDSADDARERMKAHSRELGRKPLH